MSSPYSLVVVNFYIEKFEQLAFQLVLLKLAHWFHYINEKLSFGSIVKRGYQSF